MINFIKKFIKNRKHQQNTQIDSNCNELPSDNSHGDLVQLVWMIEKLRRREGGCIMNELVAEAKRNFKGLEHIKQLIN